MGDDGEFDTVEHLPTEELKKDYKDLGQQIKESVEHIQQRKAYQKKKEGEIEELTSISKKMDYIVTSSLDRIKRQVDSYGIGVDEQFFSKQVLDLETKLTSLNKEIESIKIEINEKEITEKERSKEKEIIDSLISYNKLVRLHNEMKEVYDTKKNVLNGAFSARLQLLFDKELKHLRDTGIGALTEVEISVDPDARKISYEKNYIGGIQRIFGNIQWYEDKIKKLKSIAGAADQVAADQVAEEAKAAEAAQAEAAQAAAAEEVEENVEEDDEEDDEEEAGADQVGEEEAGADQVAEEEAGADQVAEDWFDYYLAERPYVGLVKEMNVFVENYKKRQSNWATLNHLKTKIKAHLSQFLNKYKEKKGSSEDPPEKPGEDNYITRDEYDKFIYYFDERIQLPDLPGKKFMKADILEFNFATEAPFTHAFLLNEIVDKLPNILKSKNHNILDKFKNWFFRDNVVRELLEISEGGTALSNNKWYINHIAELEQFLEVIIEERVNFLKESRAALAQRRAPGREGVRDVKSGGSQKKRKDTRRKRKDTRRKRKDTRRKIRKDTRRKTRK